MFIYLFIDIIIGIVAPLYTISRTNTMVPVISSPINDKEALDKILLRINQENVKVNVTKNGIIQVADENTAQRIRRILIWEDLIPSSIDPWNFFDDYSWKITDFERNVILQRSLTKTITEHIKAIHGIDNFHVNIVWPEKELFKSMQNPVSASVIIIPTPGSDITINRRKIEGIQKLLKLAIKGLDDENIVITD